MKKWKIAVFNVVVSKQVKKYLQKQDPVTRKRLENALLEMAEDPFTGEVKKLSGYETLFRKRVGSYRILYDVFQTRMMVDVIKVDSRGNAYKDI